MTCLFCVGWWLINRVYIFNQSEKTCCFCKPIRLKNKTNRNLVNARFPRLARVACFRLFWLVPRDILPVVINLAVYLLPVSREQLRCTWSLNCGFFSCLPQGKTVDISAKGISLLHTTNFLYFSSPNSMLLVLRYANNVLKVNMNEVFPDQDDVK